MAIFSSLASSATATPTAAASPVSAAQNPPFHMVEAALQATYRANTTPTMPVLPSLYDLIAEQLKSAKKNLEFELKNVEFYKTMLQRCEEQIPLARSRMEELEQKLRTLEAEGKGPSNEGETLDLQELRTRLEQLAHM